MLGHRAGARLPQLFDELEAVTPLREEEGRAHPQIFLERSEELVQERLEQLSLGPRAIPRAQKAIQAAIKELGFEPCRPGIRRK